MTDPNTMVIGYDAERGEPRGRVKDPNAGECVNCNRCVQVCPTGIDIRNGLQLECIGCAACVDACNEIMIKLHRPKGLVRYDSQKGLKGQKTQWIRPRTLIYTGFLALGLLVMSISVSQITPLKAGILRMQGSPYYITETSLRNHFQLRVINKTTEPARFQIQLAKAPDALQLTGADGIHELAPMDEQLFTTLVELPKTDYVGKFEFDLIITAEKDGARLATASGEFIGPNPQLLQP
ncbi:MAG: 4Fe-4S dicluster domain-containing protein [Verrucomicrobiota bacterium]